MRYPLIFLFFTGLVSSLHAQSALGPRYYQSYDHQVTGRTYLSRKFTSVTFNNSGKAYVLRYRPNTTLNLGVGATYKWATLNLAYGFGFLNPEQGRGKTKYLDLQFHSYGRKISIDVLGQFYRGFYLSPKGAATVDNQYYLRPDLRVNVLGANIQYIFNHNQFSYRAAFLQNEWQQRSAGTWLLGFELYAGSIKADSTIVPTLIDSEIAFLNIRSNTFFELGPNVGYAYTYVYRQHFFITGAASISFDLGVNTVLEGEKQKRAVGLNPNTFFRISGGYNSDVWAFSALYVANAMRLTNHEDTPSTLLRTGNVRLIVTYRFKPGKKFRSLLKTIDEVEKEIK